MASELERSRTGYIFLDHDLSGEVSTEEEKEFLNVVNSYRSDPEHEVKNLPLSDVIKVFSGGHVDASSPKYSVIKGFFLLSLVVGAISLGIYAAQSWIAIIVYVVIVSFDVLVAALCILQINHSEALRRIFPYWIFAVSTSAWSTCPHEQNLTENPAHSSYEFSPKSETKLYFEIWNHRPPFMVFFRAAFRPNTSILGCRVPSSVHPFVVICLRLGNTLVMTAGLIYRLAVTSYNEHLGFSGFAYKEKPCTVTQETPSYFTPPSLIGTAHYISIILSGVLWVATMFNLEDRSLCGLEKCIFELKRHKLSFNLYCEKYLAPEEPKVEEVDEEKEKKTFDSAFHLWTQQNKIWRQSCREHFFGKLAGFADSHTEGESAVHSSNQVVPENYLQNSQTNKRESVFGRLFFLSLFPFILAFFQTVLYQISRIPSVAEVMRLSSCANDPNLTNCSSYMATSGISSACETGIVYDILVSGNFAPLSFVLIHAFVITGTFIMVCGIVHTITVMTSTTFFLNWMRIKCLSMSIHPMHSATSTVVCPFVSLSSGKQIRSWIQLYHLEKMGGNMRFGTASAGLSSFFVALIVLGVGEVGVTIANTTIPSIAAFGCYFILVAVFFLVSLCFAALAAVVQLDIRLYAMEQQFIFGNRDHVNDDESIRDSSERIQSLVTHLEQTDGPLKLLRLIPANFLVLQLLLGYMASVLVAVVTLLWDRGALS